MFLTETARVRASERWCKDKGNLGVVIERAVVVRYRPNVANSLFIIVMARDFPMNSLSNTQVLWISLSLSKTEQVVVTVVIMKRESLFHSTVFVLI